MGLFNRQIKLIEEFEKGIFHVFENTVSSYNYVLKDYVTNKQLFQRGIDGSGKRLEGYARTTIRMKISKGQPVDRTTTVDEGKFHASIFVDAFSDRFEITSNVPHDKFVIKRYGKDVLKITENNMREFMKVYFLPNLKRYGIAKITR